MLEAKQITHTIRRKTLLDDVSLTVEPGEFLAVVGANGAGKSTLLNILSRDLMPTQGMVTLDQKGIDRYSAVDLARRRAVLAQQNALAFNFSVYELVMMGRYPHFDGQPRAEDHRIVDQVLERTGISHLVGRLVPTLSGGEQQRVHLAKVLAQLLTTDASGTSDELNQPARYLLLDEPTTGLDLFYQHSLLEVAQDLTRRGYGVVAILHDLNLVMQYASKVLLLTGGKVRGYGSPKAVLNAEAILDAFQLHVTIIDQVGLSTPLVVPNRQLIPVPVTL